MPLQETADVLSIASLQMIHQQKLDMLLYAVIIWVGQCREISENPRDISGWSTIAGKNHWLVTHVGRGYTGRPAQAGGIRPRRHQVYRSSPE